MSLHPHSSRKCWVYLQLGRHAHIIHSDLYCLCCRGQSSLLSPTFEPNTIAVLILEVVHVCQCTFIFHIEKAGVDSRLHTICHTLCNHWHHSLVCAQILQHRQCFCLLLVAILCWVRTRLQSERSATQDVGLKLPHSKASLSEGRYTKFLALDKCLPRRKFLQVCCS